MDLPLLTRRRFFQALAASAVAAAVPLPVGMPVRPSLHAIVNDDSRLWRYSNEEIQNGMQALWDDIVKESHLLEKARHYGEID